MNQIKWVDYLRLTVFPCAFIIASSLLWLLFSIRPSSENGQDPELYFPKTVEQLKSFVAALGIYKSQHHLYVLSLFSAAYLYKQTFAIPGSALLNILGGALFGCWPFGFLLCCFLTAFGATNCYILSALTGRKLFQQRFAKKLQVFECKLLSNHNQLFFFMLSLRLFPMTPNWFINIAAPVFRIPVTLFFGSVLVGLMPYNFVCVQAGEILGSIHSLDDVLTPSRIMILGALAVVTYSGTYFSQRAPKTKRSKKTQ